MKPIELERWEPAPDDPRRKVYAGQRTAQEVFEELRYRLEGMGYLPDEYLFMDREWAIVPAVFSSISCAEFFVR